MQGPQGIWCAWQDLKPKQQEALRVHYLDNIFPLVTPLAMDPAHPFPFISNLSLNLLVTLYHPDDQYPILARVKVPIGSGVPRFLKVGERNRFVRLEDVMAHNLDALFPGMQVQSCEFFRVTRDANTEQDEEDDQQHQRKAREQRGERVQCQAGQAHAGFQSGRGMGRPQPRIGGIVLSGRPPFQEGAHSLIAPGTHFVTTKWHDPGHVRA